MNDRLDISEIFLKGPLNPNQKKKKKKIVTLRGSNYRYLEIFMVRKGFEPLKFDCIISSFVLKKKKCLFRSLVTLIEKKKS